MASSRVEESGDSLLHIAARYGHLDIIRWLKDIGFPFNVVRPSVMISVCDLLIKEIGIQMNHRGRTPVHAAAERAQVAVIEYFYNFHSQSLNFRGISFPLFFHS